MARLRALTRAHGLASGDRACLALARRLGLPALTADRTWAELGLGISVVVIRPEELEFRVAVRVGEETRFVDPAAYY